MPDGTQIFLLLFLIFSALFFVGPLISALFFSFMDIPNLEEVDPNAPRIGYVMVFSGMLALFLAAFLVFFRLSGEKWKSLIHYEGIQLRYIGITLLLLVFGWLIAEGLHYLNHWIIEQFPRAGFIEAEIALNEQLKSWFDPEKQHLFPYALFIFGLLPAFVEELLFRGILMEKLIKVSGKPHFGVIVSALLFAALHMQAWNLLPMIALGVMLGYLYYFSKDIRYSMLLHFLYNGIQITAMFFWPDAIA